MVGSLPACARLLRARIALPAIMGAMRRLRDFFGLIRFEHTIFALPFALIAAIFSQRWLNALQDAAGTLPLFAPSAKWHAFTSGVFHAKVSGFGLFPSVYDLGFVLLAMVSGRTLAMLCDRIIDAEIDARNPRTASRHIPTGRISSRQAKLWALIAAVVFLLAALALNFWCFILAPLALAWLIGYPYAKRWTPYAHYILGGAQAIAPLGVFLAITATISWEILPLAVAVGLWVGSFDIYYALQDVEFDRAEGLHSLPADFGERPAMLAALVGHLLTGALLVWTCYIFQAGTLLVVATIIFTAVLVAEHILVQARRELIGVAFFTVNGCLSVGYLVVVIVVSRM